MPENSALGKALIYTSAGIGVVIGAIQLGDRFLGQQASGVVSAGQTQVAPVQESYPASEPDVTTTNNVATPGAEPALAALERDLSLRIRDALGVDCPGIFLREVSLSAKLTPAEESTSGFEGHFIDGEAVLVADDIPHRIRLAGTGKGPDGARGAAAMALRGLQDQVRVSDALKDYCKET